MFMLELVFEIEGFRKDYSFYLFVCLEATPRDAGGIYKFMAGTLTLAVLRRLVIQRIF